MAGVGRVFQGVEYPSRREACQARQREYVRGLTDGLNFTQAAHAVGVSKRTGKVWRNGRTRSSGRCERDKIRPARAIHPRFRYKNRPAHPFSSHVRYKTRPARSKWPILASFVRAGRTLYRFGHQQPEQGELCTAYKVDTESVDTTAHQVPPVWRVPEYPEGLSAVPMGGGGPGRASKRHTEPHISNQAPLLCRAPEGPEGTAVPVGAAEPGCGAGERRWGPAAAPVGGGGVRPRCRWAAAGPGRGAGGWRQGPTKHHNGAPGTPATPSNTTPGTATPRQAPQHRARTYKKPTSGSDVGLWWS